MKLYTQPGSDSGTVRNLCKCCKSFKEEANNQAHFNLSQAEGIDAWWDTSIKILFYKYLHHIYDCARLKDKNTWQNLKKKKKNISMSCSYIHATKVNTARPIDGPSNQGVGACGWGALVKISVTPPGDDLICIETKHAKEAWLLHDRSCWQAMAPSLAADAWVKRFNAHEAGQSQSETLTRGLDSRRRGRGGTPANLTW